VVFVARPFSIKRTAWSFWIEIPNHRDGVNPKQTLESSNDGKTRSRNVRDLDF
jgi:hypothetical protein